jgi:hypothetical protein
MLKDALKKVKELELDPSNMRSNVKRLKNEELLVYLLISDRYWINKCNPNWIFGTSVYEELLSRLNNKDSRIMDF